MMNLALLVTVFIVINGFVHAYSSRRFNQHTIRQKPVLQSLPLKNNNEKREGIRLCLKTTQSNQLDTSLSYCNPTESPDNDDEPETEIKQKKRRDIWKSKLDQLNEWRLNRMENRNWPVLFILRAKAYEK